MPQSLLTAACAVGFLGSAAATPYPRSNTPPAVDLGLTQNLAPATDVTLTIALKLRNADRMQSLLRSIYTRGSSNYQHFLTPQQFATQFGPSSATIAQLTRHFQADGFSVTRSATAQLKITGSIQAVQAEFGIHLHEYRVASIRSMPTASRDTARRSGSSRSPRSRRAMRMRTGSRSVSMSTLTGSTRCWWTAAPVRRAMRAARPKRPWTSSSPAASLRPQM